jgi:hypothetical protein
MFHARLAIEAKESPMLQHLRNLALTIEEVEPNSCEFFWAILESDGDTAHFPVQISTAEAPAGSYMEALRAGYEQLTALARQDPVNGPRGGLGVEEAGSPPRTVERSVLYKAHEIRATYRRIRSGGFIPAVAVKAREENAERSRICNYPRGGFADPRDAVSEALRAGQSLVDEEPQDGWYELTSGGVDAGPPLRRLALRVDETVQLGFNWAIEERGEDGWHTRTLKVAEQECATYREALRLGTQALLAMAENPERGPRAK